MKTVKYILMVSSFFAFGTLAQAYTMEKDGILKSDDGSIALMNQQDARSSCPNGYELPNIRELAKLMGVEIRELSKGPSRDFFKIKTGEQGPHVPVEEFYFKCPSKEGSSTAFWSSSTDGEDSTSMYDSSGYLIDTNGTIFPAHSYNNTAAVRCI